MLSMFPPPLNKHDFRGIFPHLRAGKDILMEVLIENLSLIVVNMRFLPLPCQITRVVIFRGFLYFFFCFVGSWKKLKERLTKHRCNYGGRWVFWRCTHSATRILKMEYTVNFLWRAKWRTETEGGMQKQPFSRLLGHKKPNRPLTYPLTPNHPL